MTKPISSGDPAAVSPSGADGEFTFCVVYHAKGQAAEPDIDLMLLGSNMPERRTINPTAFVDV